MNLGLLRLHASPKLNRDKRRYLEFVEGINIVLSSVILWSFGGQNIAFSNMSCFGKSTFVKRSILTNNWAVGLSSPNIIHALCFCGCFSNFVHDTFIRDVTVVFVDVEFSD